MKVMIWLTLAILLGGCTVAPSRGGDILTMGDSAMAWNKASGNSIGDVIGKASGRQSFNVAVSGALIAGAVGRLNIPSQYPGGQWNWIVINGGANDLGARCGCGSCAGEVSRLISRDAARGAIPALLSQMRATGAKVMWMGYYNAAKGGFYKGCRDDLHEMERRIARYADSREGIFFVDAEDVIDETDLSNFSGDKTHPSKKGSARVGRYLAQQIALN